MLAAAQRLRRREEFAATIRGGRRAGRGAVVVHLLLSDADEVPRAGFVVSRAVGNAVCRNRVRRRLRHLVRDRLAALPRGAELVVRAQPAAVTRGFAELGEDLDAALAVVLRSGRATAKARR